MPITAELFDGTRLEFPDGTDPSVVQATAKRITAERQPKEGGISGAFKSGVESYVSPTQTGIESLTGSPEEAAIRGLQRQKEISKKYETPGFEDIEKEYKEKGLFAAAKKAVGQVPEAIAAQVPQIGAMGVGATLGGIGGGALGSVIGPEGTVLGAAAGAKFGQMVGQALSEFPQFYGSNIERQAQEQIAQGKPVDINRMKAAGAAAGQTALDVFETQILFGSSMIGKFLGFTPKELAGKSAATVEKMAQESLLKTAAKGTAKGAIAEIPNEIAQQMLERAQAGLDLTSPDALHEYGQTAYQVGLLAPLGMFGSFGERAAARREVAARGTEPEAGVPPTTSPLAPAGGGAPALPAPAIPQLTVSPTQQLLPAPTPTPSETKYANPEDEAAIMKARWEEARANSPAMAKLNQMEAERKARQAAQQEKVDKMKAAQSAFTTATPEGGLYRAPTQEQIDAEQAKADSFNNFRTIAVVQDGKLNLYHGTLNEKGKVNVKDPNTGKTLTFNPNSKNVTIDPSEKELYDLETKHVLGQAVTDIDKDIGKVEKGLTGANDQFKEWLKKNPINSSEMMDILPEATKETKKGYMVNPDARAYFKKEGSPMDDILAKALEDGIITPEEYNNPADNSGENAFKRKLAAMYRDEGIVETPENADAMNHLEYLSEMRNHVQDEIERRKAATETPELAPLTPEERAAQAASPEATGIPEFAEPERALPLETPETRVEAEAPAPAPETNVSPEGRVMYERGNVASKADIERVRKMADKLRKQLNKMGLKDVGLKLADALNARVEGRMESVNGAYFDKLISLSLSGDNIFRTMNHEALHAMKDLGFFSDADWKILSEKAESEWMDKYNIAEDYGHEPKEIQIEEAIAKAFADYQTQKPNIKSIMAKAVDLVKKLGNFLRGQNARTASDVFSAAAKGELKPTTETTAGTRFEINRTTDRLTKTSGVKTAGQRLMDKVKDVYNDIQTEEFWTKAKIAWVDPTSSLAKTLSSQPVFNMKGQLRADMLARTLTQIMNYVHTGIQTGLPDINSDGTMVIRESENNLARSQILADKLDDKKIKDVNGKIMSGRDAVAEVARILRGRDVLAEDKKRNAKGLAQLAEASRLIKEYKQKQKDSGGKLPYKEANQYVNRIKKLRAEGTANKNSNRELQVKEHHIKWAEATLKQHPEINKVLDIWREINNSLVKLWQKTGLFTEAQANEYLSRENYVPLFKAKEDLDAGINRYLGVSTAKSKTEVKQLKGSLAVRNIWENMNGHFASMMTAAYQNQTRKVAIEQLKALGAAEIVDPKEFKALDNPDINARYRDPTNEFADSKGWVNAIVYNPNDLAAFEMMHYEVNGFMKFMAGATKVLRIGALVNPKYWIKQLIRDPIHATLVANSGVVTPFHAINDYIKVLNESSPEARILAQRGVIGQIDPTTDVFDFIKKAGEERSDPNALDKALHQIQRMHEMSDAATRVSIYKKAYAEAQARGMNNDQAVNFAVHKARESINFSVHGNSKMLNSIRHMIPFISAQITSLDSVYRAMRATHLSGAEKAEAQRSFRNMAMIMAATTAAYAMLYAGDEDYEKVPDIVKDNNWLIPNPLDKGSFIKIPIPFEVGYLFKTIPEVSIRYMKGTATGKETLASLKTGFLANIPGGGVSPWNFTPQAFRPILEVISNYSNFTGRPIEGMSDQGLPTEAKGSDRASELANRLSTMGLSNVGLSPAKIDYLIQAYTAELGTFTSSMASAAINAAEGKTTPAKNIEEYPGMAGFMTNPNSSKAVADFYELDHNAQTTFQWFNKLKKEGRMEEAKALLSDDQKKRLIQAEPMLRNIQTQMTTLHNQITMIKNNQRMDPEERRVRINALEKKLDQVARQGYKVAESAGINR